MKKEAGFWEKLENLKVKCNLCPHNCTIKDGALGFCGVRKNEIGKLFSLIYGSCSSMAVDPVEKKTFLSFLSWFKGFFNGYSWL